MKYRKEKGRRLAALQKNNNSANRYCAEGRDDAQRSPEHWFLDAAVYMRDGDWRQAIGAAMQGICRAEANHGRG